MFLSLNRWYAQGGPRPLMPLNETAVRQAAVEIGLFEILQKVGMTGLTIPWQVVEQCRVHGEAEKWCDRLRFPGEVDLVDIFRQTNKRKGSRFAKERWTRLREVFNSQPIETEAQETLGTLSLANGTHKFAVRITLSLACCPCLPWTLVLRPSL